MPARGLLGSAESVLTALALSTGSAFAALPPAYDRVTEMIEVMAQTGAQVAGVLARYGLLDRVERMDDGSYRVWAKDCFVRIAIRTEPAAEPMPGAGPRLVATVGAASCVVTPVK